MQHSFATLVGHVDIGPVAQQQLEHLLPLRRVLNETTLHEGCLAQIIAHVNVGSCLQLQFNVVELAVENGIAEKGLPDVVGFHFLHFLLLHFAGKRKVSKNLAIFFKILFSKSLQKLSKTKNINFEECNEFQNCKS